MGSTLCDACSERSRLVTDMRRQVEVSSKELQEGDKITDHRVACLALSPAKIKNAFETRRLNTKARVRHHRDENNVLRRRVERMKKALSKHDDVVVGKRNVSAGEVDAAPQALPPKRKGYKESCDSQQKRMRS
eukprot:CAMPEP_0194051766 /NCGR_PEP_ID=MMETSP0009_2-20130614/42273_1 /TAXON_ID=210454 /ORGANISM="Grammatophora oceanica, Strain CCMP 410" /LENGTH=132 /DNA_ID=CAMNT_0038699023 /DNA_START=178 /DNA_END=576 /DNA_ORIENTATION=-